MKSKGTIVEAETHYGSKTPWAGAVDDWLTTLTVRPTTHFSYKQALMLLAKRANIRMLSHMQLQRLAPLMVTAWEPSMRMRVATVLRQFWEFVEMPVPKPGWKRFRRSLAVGERKREPRVVPKGDFDRAVAVSNPRLSLFLRLLWETGIRLNEGLHLRVKDVSLTAGTIHVQSHEGPIPWPLKTRASNRFIPTTLTRELVDRALGEYVFARPKRVRYLQSWHKPLYTRTVAMWPKLRTTLNIAIERAGVTPFRPHDLRHTRLTTWAIGPPALPPKILQYLAGHSNVRTTLQIYAHVQPELAIAEARQLL